VVTPSLYSKSEDFSEADLVVDNLDAGTEVNLNILDDLVSWFSDPAQ